MRVVLDSNEFVFAFQERREIQVKLFKSVSPNEIFLPHLILREVIRNISFSSKNDMWEFRNGLFSIFNVIDDYIVPTSLVSKYREHGLKDADALIGAFTEYIGADVLITENRHFLREVNITEFEIVSAQQFLFAWER